jgi:hypothetical protein
MKIEEIISFDKNLILLCKEECSNIMNYKITSAHELYHALNENRNEKTVELKARRLVKKNPEIIDFVIELFDLDKPKK